VENPISVSAAGVSTNSLNVTGSGGGITLTPAGAGKFIVKATSPTNDAKIVVSGQGLPPTTFNYRVKRIPDPVAKIAGRVDGEIGNGEFKAQTGVAAFLENFDFDAKCLIQSFRVVYIARRQDAVIVQNDGPLFGAQAKDVINRAKPGDQYIFDEIKARCPGDAAGRKVNSVTLSIR
jgi:hypothetical protein